MNRLTIDVGFALLVATVYNKDNGAPTPEISVYLEDKETGMVAQDIACIGASYDERYGKILPGLIDCLVWGNSDDESYTEKFQIGYHKDE